MGDDSAVPGLFHSAEINAVSYTHLDVYKRQAQTDTRIKAVATASLVDISSAGAGLDTASWSAIADSYSCLLYTSMCIRDSFPSISLISENLSSLYTKTLIITA